MSFDLWQVVKGMRIADFPAFESSEISELLPNDWRVKISTLNNLAQYPLLMLWAAPPLASRCAKARLLFRNRK
jgi:hypothetical protein